jgi:hypothetical protein
MLIAFIGIFIKETFKKTAVSATESAASRTNRFNQPSALAQQDSDFARH